MVVWDSFPLYGLELKTYRFLAKAKYCKVIYQNNLYKTFDPQKLPKIHSNKLKFIEKNDLTSLNLVKRKQFLHVNIVKGVKFALK